MTDEQFNQLMNRLGMILFAQGCIVALLFIIARGAK